MQGAFPGGADWNDALDPGVDDRAEIQQRSDLIARELDRIARMRVPLPAAGGPAPPAPNPLMTYAGPFPPTPFFHLADKSFYILKLGDAATILARDGIWGHYLETTASIDWTDPSDQSVCQRARPFLNAVVIPVAEQAPLPVGAPGTSAGDTRLAPSPEYCLPSRDYILPSTPGLRPPLYYEIGLVTLKDILEKAEALDLAFARRMEGLGNVAAQVCWDCQDPDYDPSDRPAVMDQFMGKYMDRFYAGIDPEYGPPTGQVADEALHKHRAFCQAWARKHYKTLTPAVLGPAEALASEFYPYIEQRFHQNAKLTRAELARLLMRHEDTAAEFASCLHFYGTSLEQARGGRNACYKQMSVVTAYRAMSHKRFGDLLALKLPVLTEAFQRLGRDTHDRYFDPLVVDWHAILGQMPQTHRYFNNTSAVQGLIKRSRRNGANDGAHVPPWLVSRGGGP
jgi:hypothetical protein